MNIVHARAIARLDNRWKQFLRAYYRLPKRENIVHSLCERGISLNDVILMLSRKRDTQKALGVLIGRPVLRPNPIALRYRVNGHVPAVCRPRPKCWRDLTITFVDPCAALTKYGELIHGYELRHNTTFRTLYARGVPWRTLIRAHENGWVRTNA